MIKIQNLTASYGKKIVLSDINLELENQTYGIIGPNGSGKTTLFRVLTSFRMLTSKNILTANLKICSGDILVSDSCNNKKMIGKKNCQIGYLSQKFGCMPQLTVKEQLQYFCYLKKIPASEEEYEISRVLDAVHMSEFANQKCKKLSGGMVRRVGIAQAILGKPQFILLDEPTTGLDIEERCHFYQIFHQLEGVCPVLVSSHITEDIVEGCTNTIILKTGTILLQEKTEKIKPSLEEVYLKCMRGI
ncbi:MAG: ATP-binding cassette domain-containing protein [Lachnospiraceae bacterium]